MSETISLTGPSPEVCNENTPSYFIMLDSMAVRVSISTSKPASGPG
jgi:hypothetical protein